MVSQLEPLVSVVIPTCNRPRMLERALRSVAEQTFRNLEVIVVDDCSDCSYEHAISLYPGLRYHRNETRMGGSLSRNVGIRLANGEYIAFLDDDDEFEPNKTALQVKRFRDSGFDRLGVVYCNYRVMAEDGTFIQYGHVGPRGDVLADHLKRNIAPTSATLVNKSALDDVGGFRDLVCAQEYDLWLRMADAGYRFDYCGDVLLKMHAHSGPRISNNEKRIKGLRHIYNEKRKYFRRLDKHDVAYVKYDHYITMFREFVFMHDRKRAFREYLKAVKTIPFKIENVIEFPAFFVDYVLIMKFKSVLHRLRRLGKGGGRDGK